MKLKSKNLYGFVTVAVILVFLSLIFSSCGKSDKEQPPATEKKQTDTRETHMISKSDSTTMMNAKYVCPMHPLERSNEEGKCPVCKMKLISMDKLNKEMMEGHEALENKYAGKKDAVHFEVNTSVIKSSECEAIIGSALKKDPGVIDYHVDILNRVIHLYFDKSKTTKKNIEQFVADAGFDANDMKANPDAKNKLSEDCR